VLAVCQPSLGLHHTRTLLSPPPVANRPLPCGWKSAEYMGAFSACQLTIIGDAFMVAAGFEAPGAAVSRKWWQRQPNFLPDTTKHSLWLLERKSLYAEGCSYQSTRRLWGESIVVWNVAEVCRGWRWRRLTMNHNGWGPCLAAGEGL
jgi:hypothetical protein